MRCDATRLAFFSPTGTTRRIVDNIGLGLGFAVAERLDLTRPECLAAAHASRETVTVLGAPVYAGRLPAEAVRRLKRLHGAGGPAVLVVAYGNRAYEDALLELCDLARELGFTPVAGGAFVGEHSYSAPETPIAPGRPDARDVRAAREFGRVVAAKLERLADLETAAPLRVPGSLPYREAGLSAGPGPITVAALCQACGQCVTACPVAAVRLEADGPVTEAARCIRCCACVKGCPEGARLFDHPGLLAVAKRLAATCRERREPETFL
ncbi:4Fe-4S binding protein [Solidesulfovibrio sp.]|uniref:4Fe-4S binding protein n=1 Tax=Solidesulfovibrio sp. TaxID=2910990 RepID=UPI002B1ECADB|nr:4Fe-4S binding protein [Solidesulfovibrio sp.]MEA4856851.1 4Fe-4S binding protein [Solidesulfovibrio sp.]